MPTDHIVSLLLAERQRIDAALAALGESTQHSAPTTKQRGRPAGSGSSSAEQKSPATRKKRTFTAAQKEEARRRMKAFWAAKRRGATKKA